MPIHVFPKDSNIFSVSKWGSNGTIKATLRYDKQNPGATISFILAEYRSTGAPKSMLENPQDWQLFRFSHPQSKTVPEAMKELDSILSLAGTTLDRTAFEEVEAPELLYKCRNSINTRMAFVFRDFSGNIFLRHIYKHFRGWIEENSDSHITADALAEAVAWADQSVELPDGLPLTC